MIKINDRVSHDSKMSHKAINGNQVIDEVNEEDMEDRKSDEIKEHDNDSIKTSNSLASANA